MRRRESAAWVLVIALGAMLLAGAGWEDCGCATKRDVESLLDKADCGTRDDALYLGRLILQLSSSQ